MHDEGCFPLVAIFDMDIVVSSMNIELGEVVSIFQLVHKVRYEGEGVCIAGGVFIEIPVVLAGTKFVIFLFNKKEGGGLQRVGRLNLPSSKVFLKEVLSGFLFIRGEQVDFAYLRHEGLIEVDLMIIQSGRGDMVSHFFREDLSKVSIFQQEGDLGFRLFSSDG